MNVVDSSGWLEYFADTALASVFMEPIEDLPNLIVPVICLTEVFKRILQQRTEQDALQAVAHMHQGLVIGLTPDLAIAAAKPMAMTVIFALIGSLLLTFTLMPVLASLLQITQ